MQGSLIRILYRSITVSGALATAACFKCDDCNGNIAPVNCRVAPSLSPASAFLPVGATIALTTSIDAGCSAPIVRTSDPEVLGLVVKMPLIYVTGLKAGATSVILLAAADTTLQTRGAFAVGLPAPSR